MTETNFTVTQLATMLAEQRARETFERKQRERAEKIASGEIGPRGRPKGSVGLSTRLRSGPHAAAIASLLGRKDLTPQERMTLGVIAASVWQTSGTVTVLPVATVPVSPEEDIPIGSGL